MPSRALCASRGVNLPENPAIYKRICNTLLISQSRQDELVVAVAEANGSSAVFSEQVERLVALYKLLKAMPKGTPLPSTVHRLNKDHYPDEAEYRALPEGVTMQQYATMKRFVDSHVSCDDPSR